MAEGISFESKARAGYLALLLVLAVAMALSIQRLSSVSNRQLAELRAKEAEINLVQQLRWQAELMDSEARGYMLSSDPELLADFNLAKLQLAESARTLLARELSQQGRELLGEVERAAHAFQRMQAELIELRQRSAGIRLLRQRFESDLLPLHRALDGALGRLVEHKERSLELFYEQAMAERAAFRLHLYALLALITLTALILAWYLGSRLSKAYREERKALTAARTAVAARDEMMGIVAHDLRNPLGLISLKAALLRSGLPEGDAHRHAESIEHVARQMGQLINSMLDATTIEAGSFAVNLSPCTVGDLVRETASMFEPLCASKGVRFEQHAGCNGQSVSVDRERVLQVLSNLIGNALKFTPSGGSIALRVQPQAGAFCFTIADTGPGVPAQSLPHIFERFWNEGGPGKRGTGLGLFIARGIIQAHGGRIWAENTAEGACFSFTLPAAAELAASAPEGAATELAMPSAQH